MATPVAFFKGQKERPVQPFFIILDSHEVDVINPTFTVLKWNLPMPLVAEKDSYLVLYQMNLNVTNTANIGDIIWVKIRNVNGYRSWSSDTHGPSNTLMINHLDPNQTQLTVTQDLSRYAMHGLLLPQGTQLNNIEIELFLGPNLASHIDAEIHIEQVVYSLALVPIPE